MKNIFKMALLVAILSSMFSCGERKSNRQLFEDNLDKYVESCAPAFIQKGVDSSSARTICKCIMEKMYSLDSTFFKKSRVDIDKILESNPSEFDDCINLYKNMDSTKN